MYLLYILLYSILEFFVPMPLNQFPIIAVKSFIIVIIYGQLLLIIMIFVILKFFYLNLELNFQVFCIIQNLFFLFFQNLFELITIIIFSNLIRLFPVIFLILLTLLIHLIWLEHF